MGFDRVHNHGTPPSEERTKGEICRYWCGLAGLIIAKAAAALFLLSAIADFSAVFMLMYHNIYEAFRYLHYEAASLIVWGWVIYKLERISRKRLLRGKR